MKKFKAADYKAEHFKWEVDGKVGTITLNRPERKNPLTFESYAELGQLFRKLVHASSGIFAKSNILNHYLHLPIDIAEDVCNTPHIRDVERVLRDVEGFSQTQAKRIIALMQSDYDYRDGDGQKEAALKLAEFLDKITNEVKNGGERSS